MAVFAFGAIAAESALAGPEWLVEKHEVLTTLNAETEGLLELIKYSTSKGSTILNTIDCEGIIDGTIGPKNAAGNGTDEITKILNLAMEEIGAALTGLALACKVTTAESVLDCKNGSTASVWAQNLPWKTELELMETSTLDKIFGAGVEKEPAYDVECELGIGGHSSELCEGAANGEAINEPGTSPGAVLLLGTIANGTPRGNCTGTGTESALNIGDGNLWAIGETELTTRLLTEVDAG